MVRGVRSLPKYTREEAHAAGAEAPRRDQASDRGRIRPSRSPVRPTVQIPSKRRRRMTRGAELERVDG